MAVTVRYLLVRPVGISLKVVISGCVVQEGAGKSKAKHVGQPDSCHTGEIQAVVEKSVSATEGDNCWAD